MHDYQRQRHDAPLIRRPIRWAHIRNLADPRLEFYPEHALPTLSSRCWREELSLVGILILLAFLYFANNARRCLRRRRKLHFSRVMAGGLMLILFVYVFVNV